MVPRFEPHRSNYSFPFTDNFRKAFTYIHELFPLQHEKCRNVAQPALLRDVSQNWVHLFKLISKKKKKIESLAQNLFLGSGGMEFYHIGGKVMVTVRKNHIAFFFFKKKKYQKNPHADFAVGSLPKWQIRQDEMQWFGLSGNLILRFWKIWGKQEILLLKDSKSAYGSNPSKKSLPAKQESMETFWNAKAAYETAI